MYNLIEYSNYYSKTSGSLWKYYKDEPIANKTGVITDITAIVTGLNLSKN